MRFYAGHPLRTKDGLNVGTICLSEPFVPRSLQCHRLTLGDIVDDKPRKEFTQNERDELKELAQMVLRELESRQHEVSPLYS